MSGFWLHQGAGILCAHGAQSSVTTNNRHVRVCGQAVATLADTFSVSGCSLQIPFGVGTKPQPCVGIRWVSASTRVRVNGQPVLLQTSRSVCQSGEQIPQGQASVVRTQNRVKGILMPVHFPYRFDGRGRTAGVEGDEFIRQLIDQVLFTSPGERVNRPEFGSGLMRLVFEPLSGEVGTTLQFVAQAALEQTLSDLIRVEQLTVEREDTRLTVSVQYVVLRDERRQSATLSRELPT